MSQKVAAYTGTKNLYESMIPAVKSLIMHSDVNKIYLLIEDDEFPYEMPEEIVECINVKDQRFFRPNGPNMSSGFTYMAMMRATYCKLFPNLDRILSLDVDTIVVDDISDLWDLKLGPPMRGYYFAAAREPGRSKEGKVYTNIGVALYNLEYLRLFKGQEVIDLLNERKLPFVEQDAFNMRCQGRILLMDSAYNSTIFTDPTNDPKIIHFAGQKHWQDEPLYKQYMDIPWSDVMAAHEKLTKGADEPIDDLGYFLGENYRAKVKETRGKNKGDNEKSLNKAL